MLSPPWLRVLWPRREGPEGPMKNMAGRKKPSAEDVVRKLRRADELTAAGKTNEEIAAGLQVSPATPHNWRRSYGGMDVDAAKELTELLEQNTRLKRLLAEAELEKAQRRAVDMPKEVLGMSDRLACKVLRMGNALSLFSKRCSHFALERWRCPTSRPEPRGTTATSNRSTTGYEVERWAPNV